MRFRAGRLIDGRNRLAACKLASVEPRFEQRKVIPDPVALVVSLNVMRRNLSASQRAMIAAQAWQMADAEGKIQKQGRPSKSAQKIQFIEKPREHFSKLFSVGPVYIEQARAVLSYSPELAQAVRDGASPSIFVGADTRRKSDADPTQAVAISNVPAEQFESELAKEKPPTLEQMADLGALHTD